MASRWILYYKASENCETSFRERVYTETMKNVFANFEESQVMTVAATYV